MGRIAVVGLIVSVFASFEMGAFPTESIEIKSGQCIAGTISYPGEMDPYTFQAEAERTVVIRMGDRVGSFSTDFGDAFELYGPPNNAKLGEAFDYSAAQKSFALTETGTYTLVCHERTNRIGDYGVSIVLTGYPVEEVPGDSDIRSIANGEVVGATIDLPGDLDAAVFQADAGHTVVIRMGDRVGSFSTDFGDAFELYGPPNGAKLGDGDAFDYSAAEKSFALTETGTYTLVCHEATNRIGDYGVSIVLTGYPVDEVPGDSDIRLIANGEVVGARIDLPGDLDAARFEAEAGHTVVIRMGDRVGSFSTDFGDAFELYDPNGAKLGDGDAFDYLAAEKSFALTETGTYTLVCHEGTNRIGDYGVSIVLTGYPVEEVPGDSDIRSIANGEAVEAKIDLPGDLDAAIFQAEAGHTIVIRMGDRVGTSSNDFGDAFELYDPNGAKVGDAFDYLAAEKSFALTESGTYTLVCHEGTNRIGVYGVSIVLAGYRVAMKDWDLGPMASGQVVEAEIDPPGDLDAAIFAAVAGDTAIIRMGDRVGSFSTDFGDAFELYDPNGAKLGDAFDYSAAEKSFALTESGIYTIICHEVSNRTGVFSLSLVLAGANTPEDIDGDEVDNADELTSGTDPFDPSAASVFRIEQVLRSDGGMTVRWNSVGGIIYLVQYCDELRKDNWLDIEGSEREEKEPDGRPDTEEYTDDFGPLGPPAEGRRFYRVIIDP